MIAEIDLDRLILKRSILNQDFWFLICPVTGEAVTSEFGSTIGFLDKAEAKKALEEYLKIMAQVKQTISANQN